MRDHHPRGTRAARSAALRDLPEARGSLGTPPSARAHSTTATDHDRPASSPNRRSVYTSGDQWLPSAEALFLITYCVRCSAVSVRFVPGFRTDLTILLWDWVRRRGRSRIVRG